MKKECFLSAKSRKLRLLDVNAYLRKTLKLKEDPVKSKSDVVETWEKLFPKIMRLRFDFQTAHIFEFLKKKNLISKRRSKLRLKDVNDFLKKTLKLESDPATITNITQVWDELLPKVMETLSQSDE